LGRARPALAPGRELPRAVSALLALLLLAGLGWCAPAHATRTGGAHPLRIGFGDGLFASPDPALREDWLGRAAGVGSSIVRVNVSWAAVAPRIPPPGFDPADPASPGYAWSGIDSAVRGAAAHGLGVMLTVTGAPRWAEGPGRPPGIDPGAWRPQAPAYGAFARALAARYDGRFPDPLQPGAVLPRVRRFEAWNEPNLDTYLAPQWEGRIDVGPELYRELLNSFYEGVKAAQPDATVIGGALAPFGDAPGGERTPPVLFLRQLLCLRGSRLTRAACPHRAHLDALSDHPIAVGAPRESAASTLDVTTPDMWRLTRVMREAERRRTVLPRGRKPLWVTEFWYDSDPPDPNGVPLLRQARWYEQDLYMFWREGARVAIGLQLRDSAAGEGYPYTNQSGAFFLEGGAKPSATAFAFPFVARRADRGRVRVWGIAPHAGRVRVQARRGGRWVTIGSARTGGRPHPFSLALDLRGPARLRAMLGRAASLTWRQG
jgi:hypothetical protein